MVVCLQNCQSAKFNSLTNISSCTVYTVHRNALYTIDTIAKDSMTVINNGKNAYLLTYPKSLGNCSILQLNEHIVKRDQLLKMRDHSESQTKAITYKHSQISYHY